MRIIDGSILDSQEQYIAHQCNCLTTNSAGVARLIFDKYPFSNVYKDRMSPSEIGTIDIRGDGENDRFVINMFAQYYPGHSRYPESSKDGIAARKQYFQDCLDLISKIKDIKSIAFPWKIGCRLAGGNWDDYYSMLEKFADNNSHIDVVIYRIEP